MMGARQVVSSTVACSLLLGACSLTGLDDLGTKRCRSHLDCFQLAGSRTMLTDCPRCNDGVCVYRAGMEPVPQDLGDAELDTLTASQDGPGGPALLIGTGTAQFYAHGWQVMPGAGLSAGTRIDYADDGHAGCPLHLEEDREHAPGCSISEHASIWVSNGFALGASINSATCARRGQLRVGLSRDPATPFELSIASADEQLRFGVEGEMPNDCDDWPGATAPALGGVCDDTGSCSEALVVWIADRGRDSMAKPFLGELRVAQLEIRLMQSTRVRAKKTCDALDEAFAHVAPRVLGSRAGQAPGYLVAYVGKDGLVLSSLDGRDPCSPRRSIRLDPTARGIALSRGPARGSGQDVLVAWTGGPNRAPRVEAALINWDDGDLGKPTRLTLRDAPTDVVLPDPPTAAFRSEGFSVGGRPTGGWALSWTESSDARSSVFATRIDASEPARQGSVERLSEAARLPFVMTDADAPFAFGFVSAEGSASQLTVLGCQKAKTRE